MFEVILLRLRTEVFSTEEKTMDSVEEVLSFRPFDDIMYEMGLSLT